MIKLIKKVIHKCICIANQMVYRFIPINDKTVLFISFHGRGFSDNPKAIFEYMYKSDEYNDYHLVWAIKHPKGLKIEGAKVIPYFSLRYFFYLAHSKYWICNCKLPKYVLKKQLQIYLQTWHGTPLKRLAHDIIVPDGTTFYRSGIDADEMRRSYDNDVQRYTYMISPNQFCTDVFQSAFAIERKKLIETGYPRNDVLVNTKQEEIQNIRKKYHIPDDKKVILYAPTWRDNQFAMSGYTFELKVDFKKWKEILSPEYIVLFKPHYLIVNNFELDDKTKEFVYEIGAKQDISELYLISDVLITDYSSVFFDYAILKHPIYFYMYDIEEYAEELRGFYLDIHKELPGMIYKDENLLLKDINEKNFDFSKLEIFNQRFNHMEDGKAASRVLDIVMKREDN